jgi:hypothetical protein
MTTRLDIGILLKWINDLFLFVRYCIYVLLIENHNLKLFHISKWQNQRLLSQTMQLLSSLKHYITWNNFQHGKENLSKQSFNEIFLSSTEEDELIYKINLSSYRLIHSSFSQRVPH